VGVAIRRRDAAVVTHLIWQHYHAPVRHDDPALAIAAIGAEVACSREHDLLAGLDEGAPEIFGNR
jgi:hypothetical protein